MNLRVATLLLAANLLQADTLADLKANLSRLNGQETVKANVEYQFWKKQGDDKNARVSEGKATTSVEEGPHGLKLAWSRSLIQMAAQEAKAQVKDPNHKDATRRALEGLKAVQVLDYVNGAEVLLRTLEQCQFLEEKAGTWQGKPARLLQFKFMPKLSKQDQKYVKDLEASATLWIGGDGLPLAIESQVRTKGRAMLVISFEELQKDTYQFTRIGNRLLVLQHSRESSGSGGGEQNQSKVVITLTPEGKNPS